MKKIKLGGGDTTLILRANGKIEMLARPVYEGKTQ